MPVLKSEDINNVGNFRSISVVPIFSKILEKLMFVRMSNFFNKHHILNIHQHGLDRRTPITVHSLIDYITAALDKKVCCCCTLH